MCTIAAMHKMFTNGYRENEQMVLPVEKKMSELEMGLLHLQQNIGIPEITLVIHPTVALVCLR